MPLFVPSLKKRPHRGWDVYLIIIPRLGYYDGHRKRSVLWPGFYETRVSQLQNHRIWRKL